MAFVTLAGLAYASLAATAVSTGVAVYSSVQQAKAAEDTAEHNAKIAESEANLKHATGLENIRRQRSQNRRYLSRQRALISGQGISLEGTALQVMGKTAGTLELGVLDAFHSTQLAVNKSLSEAQSQRFQGSQAKAAGYTRAGATLLSGVTKAAGQTYNFKDDGVI